MREGTLVGTVWMYYLLLYDVIPEYANRREQYRAEHLALAQAALP